MTDLLCSPRIVVIQPRVQTHGRTKIYLYSDREVRILSITSAARESDIHDVLLTTPSEKSIRGPCSPKGQIKQAHTGDPTERRALTHVTDA